MSMWGSERAPWIELSCYHWYFMTIWGLNVLYKYIEDRISRCRRIEEEQVVKRFAAQYCWIIFRTMTSFHEPLQQSGYRKCNRPHLKLHWSVEYLQVHYLGSASSSEFSKS